MESPDDAPAHDLDPLFLPYASFKASARTFGLPMLISQCRLGIDVVAAVRGKGPLRGEEPVVVMWEATPYWLAMHVITLCEELLERFNGGPSARKEFGKLQLVWLRNAMPDLRSYARSVLHEWWQAEVASGRRIPPSGGRRPEDDLAPRGTEQGAIPLDYPDRPYWLGWDDFHRSHRVELCRRHPTHFRPLFYGVYPDDPTPLMWPPQKQGMAVVAALQQWR